MILSDLDNDILGRLEENVESGPIFWNLTGEIYPAMVDGIFEASLITGVVQLQSQQVTLDKNRTWFPLQRCAAGLGTVPTGVPVGIVAPLRMRAPYQIRKTSLRALDDMIPKWQQASPGTQIKAWFPLGLSGFGIYPQLSAGQNVVMDFLFCPVNQARPLTGNETIPLQVEFTDLLSKYGASMLRVKEGSAEADEAGIVFNEYMSELKDLSLFQNRLDSLVLTAALGGRSQVNDQTSV